MKHAIRTPDTAPTDDAAPMDDLVAGLAKAKRGPWLTRSTGILLALVLTCGGFLAGVQVQQRFGTGSGTAAGTATGNRPANGYRGNFGGQYGFPGGMPGGQQGQTGGQQTAAAPISGKIKLVDGTTVYIETADGSVLTIKTGENTTVQATEKITLKDLAAGTDITVQGTTQDTTVTATSITTAG
ncbi:hypothetical protein CS0771_14520 [Catellatospora sp. IY07-71]|uniref:hypothetical protein n=1 Tax=Catellatospora sp. IY07-71 TaxID=2728827 RepID=UPI001BB3C686|nr:hypothetical protein [Catellatospora sp. IY07-71]BCJ71908.1 hypothetical protein CS0771_14520 [Catellatospora sp. IY07-71]